MTNNKTNSSSNDTEDDDVIRFSQINTKYTEVHVNTYELHSPPPPLHTTSLPSANNNTTNEEDDAVDTSANNNLSEADNNNTDVADTDVDQEQQQPLPAPATTTAAKKPATDSTTLLSTTTKANGDISGGLSASVIPRAFTGTAGAELTAAQRNKEFFKRVKEVSQPYRCVYERVYIYVQCMCVITC